MCIYSHHGRGLIPTVMLAPGLVLHPRVLKASMSVDWIAEWKWDKWAAIRLAVINCMFWFWSPGNVHAFSPRVRIGPKFDTSPWTSTPSNSPQNLYVCGFYWKWKRKLGSGLAAANCKIWFWPPANVHAFSPRAGIDLKSKASPWTNTPTKSPQSLNVCGLNWKLERK